MTTTYTDATRNMLASRLRSIKEKPIITNNKKPQNTVKHQMLHHINELMDHNQEYTHVESAFLPDDEETLSHVLWDLKHLDPQQLKIPPDYTYRLSKLNFDFQMEKQGGRQLHTIRTADALIIEYL